MRTFSSASSAASYFVLKCTNVAGWSFCRLLLSGTASRPKIGTKRLNSFSQPRKDWTSDSDVKVLS